MVLKSEEKLSQKKGQRDQGISQPRGKSVAQDRNKKPKEEWKKTQTQTERGVSSQRGKYTEQRGQYADGNIFPRTRGRGRGRGGVVK
jgi:hypothetical protein